MKTLVDRMLLTALALPLGLSLTVLNSTVLQSADVYLANSGNTTWNTDQKTLLQGAGHTVTDGAAWYQFDGTQDFSGIDVIVMPANYNWNTGAMNEAGQAALVAFVRNGGGLVTTEWLIYNHFPSETIAQVFAASPSQNFDFQSSTTSVTFTRSAPDPVINSGVPETFSFNTTSISGRETYLIPKSGAFRFYNSASFPLFSVQAGGLIGWNYFKGRSIHFSTTSGLSEFASTDFRQLFLNSVQWAATPDTIAPKIKPGKFAARGTSAQVALQVTDDRQVATVTLKAPGQKLIRARLGGGKWKATVKNVSRPRTSVLVSATDLSGNKSGKRITIIRK